MKTNMHLNLSSDEIEQVLREKDVSENIIEKAVGDNSRVEFVSSERNLFLVFYIPEYNKIRKSIDAIEINMLYDTKSKTLDLFANNTSYFFEKYSKEIQEIESRSIGSFYEKFLTLVYEDVSRILNHILDDINEIRREYADKDDNYKVIRHLTNAQLNITNLKLIFSNQDKIIEMVDDYMSKTLQTSLSYKKNYLEHELSYAREFCVNVMQSINTKYSVRTSDDMYRFNKYSSIIVVSNFFITFLLLFRDSTMNQTREYFYLSVVLVLISSFIVVTFFRNKK